MRRFFAGEIDERSKEVVIRGEEFAHLKKVLRLKQGDRVTLFNGRGLELLCTVKSISRSCASVAVDAVSEGKGESGLEITLLQGLIRGHKPDIVIQKATELGVKKIVFYPAGRSVPAVVKERMEKRLTRWRRIAVEAVKQCGRAVVPEICVSKSLEEAVASARGLKIVLFEGGGAALKEVVKKFSLEGDGNNIALLIGPEGGFSPDEMGLAKAGGFTAVGLGPRILRAETASLAAIAILQYALGDL